MSLLRRRALMLSKPSTPWDALVASLSPRLWLKFNETSGTVAADSSGNGFNGTYTGGAAVTLNQAPIFANMGASARFGSGGYVRVADNANLRMTTQDFIVGVAFKLDGASGRGQFPKMIWKTTNYTNGHANYLLQFLRDSPNKISGRVSINGGSDYFDTPVSTTTFANATPYLVFLRRLGDKMSLWVNGVKETEATLPSPATVLRTSADPLDTMGGPGSSLDPTIAFGDEALLIVGSIDDATMAALWAARQ